MHFDPVEDEAVQLPPDRLLGGLFASGRHPCVDQSIERRQLRGVSLRPVEVLERLLELGGQWKIPASMMIVPAASIPRMTHSAFLSSTFWSALPSSYPLS